MSGAVVVPVFAVRAIGAFVAHDVPVAFVSSGRSSVDALRPLDSIVSRKQGGVGDFLLCDDRRGQICTHRHENTFQSAERHDSSDSCHKLRHSPLPSVSEELRVAA